MLNLGQLIFGVNFKDEEKEMASGGRRDCPGKRGCSLQAVRKRGIPKSLLNG